MNARHSFWRGFVVGGALVATCAGLACGWMTWGNRPHKHVLGRWRTGAPVPMGTGAWPMNERRCLICGWREFALARQNQPPMK